GPSRLPRFSRRRVPAPRHAEDILQDFFYELVEANRLLMPIERGTAWLLRVARNRISDLFRKKRPEPLAAGPAPEDDEERLGLEDVLPSREAGPEGLLGRSVVLEWRERGVDALAPGT